MSSTAAFLRHFCKGFRTFRVPFGTDSIIYITVISFLIHLEQICRQQSPVLRPLTRSCKMQGAEKHRWSQCTEEHQWTQGWRRTCQDANVTAAIHWFFGTDSIIYSSVMIDIRRLRRSAVNGSPLSEKREERKRTKSEIEGPASRRSRSRTGTLRDDGELIQGRVGD